MARSLWLCNLVLALLTLALVWGMVQSFSAPSDSGEEARPVPKVAQEAAPASEKDALASQIGASSPPLTDFDIIVSKETFKNPLALVQRATVAPPPPPIPLPALIGTMIVGEERKAVLVGANRTEIYRIGQSVAGGKLVAIEADRVSIERGGTTEVILLKAALQPVVSGLPRPQPQPTGDQSDSAETPPAAASDPSLLLLRNTRGGSRGSGR